MWTYTRGVGITTFHSASIFDNKEGSKPRKLCIFFQIFRPFLLLTLSKLKFWKPRQLYQLRGPTHEVLRLLLSSLLHCLITKRAQNQEKRAFLLVFRSFILLTLSYLKFWKPRHLYQPRGPTPEVLGLLPSTLLQFWITKGLRTKKNMHFFNFPPVFFLTLSKLNFWQARQLYQPCGLTHENLG